MAMLDETQEEISRLEEYIDSHGSTEAVLRELTDHYRSMVFFHQVLTEDAAAAEEAQGRLVEIYGDLIEISEDDLPYRLELIYMTLQDDPASEQAERHIGDLTEALRLEPNYQVHLSLVGLLANFDREEANEEAEWLDAFFRELIDEGSAESEDLFFYAVLRGEHFNDQEQALEILEQIMLQEDEESPAFQDAQAYFDYLNSEQALE